MTKSEADRYAQRLRSMAGKLMNDLASGKAEQCGCQEAVKDAHDGLCRAFFQVEEKYNIY